MAYSGLGRLGIITPPVILAEEPYGTTVTNRNPLAYWRLSQTSGNFLDVMGTRHAMPSGTIIRGAPGLPSNSDAAANFAGTGTAAVPNDAGLQLATFSLSFWVTVNTLPVDGGRSPILSKDQSGFFDGDFYVVIEDTGEITIAFQEATGSLTHSLSADELEAGVPLHLMILADATGFWAYRDGKYLGKNTSWTGGLTSNAQPLRLASAPWSTITGDVILDELALWSRLLSEASIAALAQRTDPPVAVADVVSLPESATTAINVLANDDYVGTPTITITTPPDSEDDSAVVSGAQINYTAAAVSGGNALRTFAYRLNDLLGQSDPATVSVTVLDAATPVVSNANCYDLTTGDSVEVSSIAALVTAINGAPSGGRQIRITPGTYTGGTQTLNRTGTAPVVVMPSDGRGTVTINSPLWTLAAGSSKIVLADLYTTNPRFIVNGSNHRLTRCRARDVGRVCVQVEAATDLRVDHWDVTGYRVGTADKIFVRFNPSQHDNGSCRRCLMDYNYIHDVPLPAGVANADTHNWVVHNGSATVNWDTQPGHIIDHCLVRNFFGQGEFINTKCSGYVIRYCTFSGVYSYLQQRAGGGWEVRSNWFENMSNDAPIKSFNEWASGAGPNLVIGNRLVNEDIWVGAGNENGGDTHTTSPWPYHRCRQGQYIGNVCRTIIVGDTWGNDIFPALNCNVYGNTAAINLRFESGTTQVNPATSPPATAPDSADHDPWYTYEAATKLATPTLAAGDQVGMFAPDPLCPSGPQS